MWIITGPIFDAAPSWSKGAMTLPSGVPIPSKMFKVLISGTRSNPQFTCFIMANENLPKSMATVRSSLVTLAEVEEATGLDLTPELDQETKSRAAGVKDPNQWLVKKAKEQE
jgi:DNA/RNA endonuclease G (NUC1)